MSGPTREADFADLADDPAPAHMARETDLGALLDTHAAGVTLSRDRAGTDVDAVAEAVARCASADRARGCRSLHDALAARTAKAVDETLARLASLPGRPREM